jgi:hypothetical protein
VRRSELRSLAGRGNFDYEFELLDEQVEWRRGKLILEPIGGVNLRVRPRGRVRAAA